MRVLLDECVPRKLRREFPGHEVRTVTEMGWGGTRNGALLRRAAGEFDLLLTVDTNLEYQQNTSALPGCPDKGWTGRFQAVPFPAHSER